MFEKDVGAFDEALVRNRHSRSKPSERGTSRPGLVGEKLLEIIRCAAKFGVARVVISYLEEPGRKILLQHVSHG
jgi:hypothetical protein